MRQESLLIRAMIAFRHSSLDNAIYHRFIAIRGGLRQYGIDIVTFISQGSVTAFAPYRIQFPTLCLVPGYIDGEGTNS